MSEYEIARFKLEQAIKKYTSSNLEDWPIDSPIGKDIGTLYKKIVFSALYVKIEACAYEISDGKHQVD